MNREIIDINKEYGLVLAGGGTKGCYEIGVWKALNELGVKIKAVSGTSIGAINGAFFALRDFETAYEIWSNINISNFIEIESDNMIAMFIKAIRSSGLNVDPLRAMMDKYFDEDRIRGSDIDYGLVTYSLSDRKPVTVMKKDIPIGRINDYIMASANLPIFKTAEIDGKKFIDGGVYDNIPAPLLANSGIRDIIIVHLSGTVPSKNHTAKSLGIDSLYNIKNSSELCGILEFNHEKIMTGIEMGYLDAMKAFGKVHGKKYFLNTSVEEYEHTKYLKPVTDIELIGILDRIREDSNGDSRSMRYPLIKRLYEYSEHKLTSKTVLQACLEITAELFDMEHIRLYSADELYSRVLEEYKKTMESIEYVQSRKTLMEMYKSMEFNDINKKNLAAYFISLGASDKTSKKYLLKYVPKVYIAYLFLDFMKTRDKRLLAK
ncbi:NTE family protein [Dethiosulfatibacter aminovorans DSM 17477]|uniref:NTE family protein n=1 Tax=Dethiosulfatibacter aminovorans DSM 17477 TaxID=1121476 RepID=A0A1M6FMY3_9FIRM|nr:patatin-like phospholipase family protein [Dethiosulfatibacter aminovorans]SHI99042.1 NTE family protein [Dethiosulfatibacter aminovorans DSM 17477]